MHCKTQFRSGYRKKWNPPNSDVTNFTLPVLLHSTTYMTSFAVYRPSWLLESKAKDVYFSCTVKSKQETFPAKKLVIHFWLFWLAIKSNHSSWLQVCFLACGGNQNIYSCNVEKFSADNFFLEKKQFPFRAQRGMEVFLRERNGGQQIFSCVA